MNTRDTITKKQVKLNEKYKKLIEDAYNFQQTDAALSDLSEYKAIKLLNKINKLKYLTRESQLQKN
ncbi:Lacal_2735 family protein [Algibacter sp. 2305UL17-15]|uniref:Lacal_2735 family protein n=1 Tax=Algibacter sp. 2305UL17-15 TaxID=3231268 RepID=UPI0034579DC7